MENWALALQKGMDAFTATLASVPQLGMWYSFLVRLALPVLALVIVIRAIRSLFKVPCLPEVWAYLMLPNGGKEVLTHWENIMGRSEKADVILNYPTISRQHAALIRAEDDTWTIYDLDSKGGITVNGKPTGEKAAVKYGDVIALGGVETVLLPVSSEEKEKYRRRRKAYRPIPWQLEAVLLTLFQALAMFQLILSEGEGASIAIPLVFAGLIAVMWCYFLVLRRLRQVGFEMEVMAFFLSTLSLCITCSSNTPALPKQFCAMVLGVLVFLILGSFMRDLERVKRIRWLMSAAAIGLVSLTLVLGVPTQFGAANWIHLGGLSLQPSELAKACYVFAGAATLDRLFRKRNLGLFMLLTFICLGSLALMSDFGTAAIFFVTFLVIAFLRSGDWGTLTLICGGAVFAILVVQAVKPYILNRFATWGHAWQNASAGSGYQQTRAMSAAASGGLIGVGAGNGWLHRVAAADTDLVFGMVCEEWGLIIALLTVVVIVALAVFAVRSSQTGRSSFYVIAACGASSMMVFQTCLNVLGAVDLLPLTGVTFPFVSNGGTAMVASWGLLAFLKASDTRQNASFAIRLPSLHQERSHDRLAPGKQTGGGRR